MKRLYDWINACSQSPYGGWALFLLAFVESAFFPVPPDILLIALCVGRPQQALRFAVVCSLGSVLGGVAGYGIGVFAFESVGQPLLDWFDPGGAGFEQVRQLMDRWGFWSVLAAAVTPIPYKVFTIASGVFHFSVAQFLLASILGRSARFVAEGGLIFFGGSRFKEWIETYFDAIAWSALAMIGLGILALRLV